MEYMYLTNLLDLAKNIVSGNFYFDLDIALINCEDIWTNSVPFFMLLPFPIVGIFSVHCDDNYDCIERSSFCCCCTF